jgi:hypothetical protein
MASEQTYRIEHIFRPLTAHQVVEYRQKLNHMEEQFLKEVVIYKAKEKERLEIKFEELESVPEECQEILQ